MSDHPGFDNRLILEYVGNRKKKQFKPRTDHFLWEEMDFIARFRMSKSMVRQLTSLIANDITTSTNKNYAVCAADQILITLHFYATGTMQRCTGDISGVHKSTVSRIVDRVSRAIARLRPQYIVFPQTENEIQRCANEFYSIARFPNTIGAIDCTHVGILSPGGNNAEYYRNRKDYFSYNVQAIVDAKCKITNIVARWPGSTHDSTIFNNSRIKGKLEDGLYGARHLVGDRGYAVKPYLLTPLANPLSDAELLYNESQIRTRNVVERTFGIWKRRFPAVGMKLRIDATRVEAVIVATAVLHNICTDNNVTEPPDFAVILQEIDGGHFPENVGQGNNDIRQNLVNSYFAHLL